MTENKLDTELLKQFSPFNVMAEQSLKEVVNKANLVSKASGRMLFKREDERRWCHWIIKGSLDLVDENYETELVDTGVETPDHMLDDNYHYQRTAVAVADCVLIELGQDELDLILTVDQATGDDDDDDWMTRLLQSRLFELIPPANIQALFNEFKPVDFRRGDVIFNQGNTGDFFYVVKTGKLSIDRVIDEESQNLATIGAGDFFGEDALVSDAPRNASITMLTDGVLMRLGKTEFDALMVKPASEFVTQEEVNNVIAAREQNIVLVDVRHPKEIEADPMPQGTVNIPLQLLRDYAAKLDQETVYVVATPGRRAELGAFILNQAGFDTYILKQ